MIVFHKDGKRFGGWGINRFPDGQVQFWIEAIGKSIDLDISIKTPEELDLFFQIIHTVHLKSIRIVYLYGARSDKDTAGTRIVANLPQIIFLSISGSKCSPNWTDIEVVNPHCKTPYFGICPMHQEIRENQPGYDLIIYPDRSARDRLWGALPDIPSVECEKSRDQVSGTITKHVVPDIGSARKVLVADDLCDGGRTFIDIAEQLPQSVAKDLYVTHGVFSGSALQKLFDLYGEIWTTNSYQEIPGLKTLNVWRCI